MRKRAVVVVAALGLLVAACGNATDSSQQNASGNGGTLAPVSEADLQKNIPSNQPGVTDSEIRVGGIVSKTNPLGGNYDRAFQGVQAYFDMVNAEGGLYGRQLELVAERDDQVANNQAEAQALISQENVFAVLPVATLLFTGADTLAGAGVPTFGWNINQEWAGPKNLFGERGSYLCFTCAYPGIPWLAKQNNRTKVGVLAYTVPQSADCAKGVKESFAKYPTAQVVFEDSALSFGTTDFSVQVGKMKDAGVDFVATCMDTNGVINLTKEMRKQQLDATQSIVNAYNPEFVQNFGDLFEGDYVATWSMPFETPNPPESMQKYLEWIDKTGGVRDELSMAGWLDADLFVRGLKAAGPEFTRQKVIDAINTMKWDADGLIPGIDWSVGHDQDVTADCYAFSKIEGGKFVPQYQEPGKPFICFPKGSPPGTEPDNRATIFS